MKNPRTIIALIPAAGAPSNIIRGHTNLPDTMLPINGKAVIGHILDDLISRNITKAVIALRKSDRLTERYVRLTYNNRLEVKFVSVPKNSGKGIAHTISLTTKHIPTNHGVLIYLGDTIYKGPLSFNKSFLVTDDSISNPAKWCMVEEKDGKLVFFNKPSAYEGNGAALCGLYYFHDSDLFIKALHQQSHTHISDIVDAYQKKDPHTLIRAERWYDCGNIENYHQARIDFLKLRDFNNLDYNSMQGVITKHSTNKEKILNEILWYEKLPSDLKIFTPRLLNTQTKNGKASYTLEFYGYPSLADIYTFGDEDILLWELIIKKILDIHAIFRKYNKKIAYKEYQEMYVKKTIERLQSLALIPYWRKLMNYDEIIINGIPHRNICGLIDKLPILTKTLYKKSAKDMAIIHGDLCLGNILCDANNLLIKFVDPRGSFGRRGVYGDQKYDLAKLRHSFHGKYDFIIADLFSLTESGSKFTFQTHTEDRHHEIAKRFDNALMNRGFNLEHIALIEGLLFLSMIPLHAENPARQKAMYLTGISILQPYLTQ